MGDGVGLGYGMAAHASSTLLCCFHHNSMKHAVHLISSKLNSHPCLVCLLRADTAALLQLPSLRILRLATSSVIATDSLLEQLPRCRSLEALDMPGCSNFTDEGGLCHVARMPHLTRLSCSYCQHNVSGAGLEGATQLRVLELQGTGALHLSCLCVSPFPPCQELRSASTHVLVPTWKYVGD